MSLAQRATALSHTCWSPFVVSLPGKGGHILSPYVSNIRLVRSTGRSHSSRCIRTVCAAVREPKLAKAALQNCRIARRSIRAAVWLRSLEVFFCVLYLLLVAERTKRLPTWRSRRQGPCAGRSDIPIVYQCPTDKDLGVQYFIFLYPEI